VNHDFDGSTFNNILDLDGDFIEEYIVWMFARKERLSRYDESRDYSFIWKQTDFREIMHKATQKIFEYESEYGDFSYFQNFFWVSHSDDKPKSISLDQESFIRELIENRYGEEQFMKCVFSLICNLTVSSRVNFISQFIKVNNSFEVFTKLPLESGIDSWSGSAVPILQNRIEYYQSLLPLFNTVNFLRHKQHVEGIIRNIRKEIEHEKKCDFVSGTSWDC
jgi:hypothetical protein